MDLLRLRIGVLIAFALWLVPGAPAQDKKATAPTKVQAPPDIGTPSMDASVREQRGKLVALESELRSGFSKISKKALPEAKRKLPAASAAAFDWVRVLGLTPVHEQDTKPNCTAQACIAAMEWNWQMRNGTTTKPLLSPQPVLDRLQKEGSLTFPEVLDQLLLQGTNLWAHYPYTGEVQKPKAKVATPYRLVGWGLVGSSGKASVEEIKEALLEHGPLVTGVHASVAFENYKGGVFAEKSAVIPKDKPINHALIIIGWDDKRGKGCWHLQNSWSNKWGETGGMWIEYGCNNIGYVTFWVRAQSVQYNFPPDAHRLLGENVTPFYRWPAAKDVTIAKKE